MMRDVFLTAQQAVVQVSGSGGSGTAVAVAGSLFLTCQHVIANNTDLVISKGKRQVSVSVVAQNARADLALLKLEAPLTISPMELCAIETISGSVLDDFEEVVLAGSAGDFPGIVVECRNQGLRREGGQKRYLITAPAVMLGGLSGGALVDANERLVGLFLSGDASEGLPLTSFGYAVPSPTIKRFLRSYLTTALSPAHT